MDRYTEETGVTSGAHKKQQVIAGLRWCCLRDLNQAVVIHLLSYQCHLPPPVLVRVTTHHPQHQCRSPQLNHLCLQRKTCKTSRILLHQLLQHEVDESLDPLHALRTTSLWDIAKNKWTTSVRHYQEKMDMTKLFFIFFIVDLNRTVTWRWLF